LLLACTIAILVEIASGKRVNACGYEKLMIVNDAFMTRSPANINLRSMTVDGELNICHENRLVAETMVGAACEEGFCYGASDIPEAAFRARQHVIAMRVTRKMEWLQLPRLPVFHIPLPSVVGMTEL
jgi:hypothetical protein